MRVSLAIACGAQLLSACWSAPEPGRPRTPVQVLLRPLEPDFTTAAFAARGRHLGWAWRQLTQEPGRAADAAPVPARALGSELRRASALPAAAAGLLHRETNRAGQLHHDARMMLWQVAAPASDHDHHVAAAAQLLGIDEAPLGEIDDRRHRTDPDDDHPEASLWQRIARRLRL